MNIEAKLKHLEFIQNTISRMAHNSFLLKGWAITMLGALLGLNKDNINFKITSIAIFIILELMENLGVYFTLVSR
jgi:hypothetical protein